MSIFFIFFFAVALCSGVGGYMWAKAFFNDIKNNLNAINEIGQPKKQQAKFTKNLFGTVSDHSVGIELSVA